MFDDGRVLHGRIEELTIPELNMQKFRNERNRDDCQFALSSGELKTEDAKGATMGEVDAQVAINLIDEEIERRKQKVEAEQAA